MHCLQLLKLFINVVNKLFQQIEDMLVRLFSILFQSDIGFGKLETYVKLGKLGEVRCFYFPWWKQQEKKLKT